MFDRIKRYWIKIKPSVRTGISLLKRLWRSQVTNWLWAASLVLLRYTLRMIKWLLSPIWGPVWLLIIVARITLSFVCGRRSRHWQHRHEERLQEKKESKERRLKAMPGLRRYYGLALSVWLLVQMFRILWRAIISPRTLLLFLLHRLFAATDYVLECRRDTLQAKINRKAAEKEQQRKRYSDFLEHEKELRREAARASQRAEVFALFDDF